MTSTCKRCNRTFNTKQALKQHYRDSAAHALTYDCEECDRPFKTEQALEQHRRDSRAHIAQNSAGHVGQSFDIRPSRHKDVSKLLRQYGLSFDFFPIDDPHGYIKEHDSNIMGIFTCTNTSCPSLRWSSKKIAITIRQYPGLRYNARVYYQRCKSCKALSVPELDDSYAERVSYRLAKWSGIDVPTPPISDGSGKPHQPHLCEGCRHGRCQRSQT